MNFKQHKLKNGTRVITIPHADTAAVTVLALYEVGSRYENAALSGASHFIEHLMFKGTRRRPTTLDISRDLDSVGADYNAFTAKDYTGYYIKLQSGRFELAADMLQDMIYHSLFRTRDVTSERQVILEELRMYEDNPLMLVEELVEEELYRGSPLGQRIGGTVESVKGLTPVDLINYRNCYYVPARTVLAVAGKFDEAQVIETLEKTFGRSISHGRPRPFQRFNKAQAGFRKPRVKVLERDTEQVQAALAFPAFGYFDRELPAAKVLAVILGGTMSSRLFTSVREREGLCYFIRATANAYQDIGDFTIQTGLAKDRVDHALRLIMSELSRIRDKFVSAEELSRAKEYIRGRTLLALEDSSHQADWYAKQELLLQHVQTPEQKITNIMAVTRADIRRVAQRIFNRRHLSMAIIGPLKDDRQLISATEAL
ncbi:insulinase family protein [Patescibacteria group bacterium]|nr:insulinase family protein [Patescibacteria group bacterium]